MKKLIISVVALLASLTCFVGCAKEDFLTPVTSSTESSSSNSETSSSSSEESNVESSVESNVESSVESNEESSVESSVESNEESSVASSDESSTSSSVEEEDPLADAAEYLEDMYRASNKETRNDYEVISSIFGYEITWSVDVEGIEVVQGSGTEKTTIKVSGVSEDVTYVLTATISDGEGNSKTVEFERKALAALDKIPQAITQKPAEDTPYKLYVYQSTKAADCYFTGEMSGYYFATAEVYEGTPDLYVEYIEGTDNFYVYFDKAGVKTYIGVRLSDDGAHNNVVMDTVPVSEFFWNAKIGTICTHLEKDKDGKASDFYLGNYASHMTFSASTISYAGGAGNNVGGLVEMVSKDSISPETKIAEVKETLNVQAEHRVDKTINLVTSDERYPDVEITWTLSESANASILDNELTLTIPAEAATVTLTATLTCGEATDTKVFELTLGPAIATPTTEEEIVNAAYSLAKGETLPGTYTLTGVITKVNTAYSADYQNVTVTITVADKAIECYRLKGEGADLIKVGDTITVTGSLKNYNGKVEFDQGCTLDSYVPGQGGSDSSDDSSDVEDSELVATVPVVDKAYIFGMTQGNLDNAVYYLAGGMDGYYMATTTDPTAAIETYIEATEGGYYFYTYVDGVKTYINMVVSGTHVNGAYEATASTVYTIDEEHHTLIAIVNDTEYWFGTRNDKTYATMGPCAVSYNGFYGEFYAEGVSGSDSSDDSSDVEDSELVATVPVVDKAYIFGMTQGNLDNAIYYLAGGMDGYYMATTTDPTAAIETYIEATEGGYYFYTYVDGVKTYINMVVSGTHVNGAYEATASTVYTIDEEHHTLIAIVNDTEYWFGTRNDKTYATMGPCAVSYNGFYGEFYAPAEGGNDSSEDSSSEVPPVDSSEDSSSEVPPVDSSEDSSSEVPPVDSSEDSSADSSTDSSVDSSVEDVTKEETLEIFATTGVLAEDGNSISWTGENFVFLNEKNTSSSPIRVTDADHFRVYKYNKTTISATNGAKITKIVITCTNATQVGYLTGTTFSEGVTVSTNDLEVTFTVNEGTIDTFVIEATNNQWRLNKITVYFQAQESGETPAPATYTLILRDGSPLTGFTMYEEYQYAEGTALDLPQLTAEGKTFLGWFDIEDKAAPETMPAEAIALMAKWEITPYTLTIKQEGAEDKVFTFGVETTMTGIDITVNDLAYVLEDNLVEGYAYAEAIPEAFELKDYTFTLVSTAPVTYTLILRDGSPLTGFTMYEEYQYAEGTALDLPQLTAEGKTFLGWFDIEDKAAPATMPAEAIALMAKWEITPYTLTIKQEGAEDKVFTFGVETTMTGIDITVNDLTYVLEDNLVEGYKYAEAIPEVFALQNYTFTLVSAHTHEYTSAVTAPTCTEAGYTTYTCECGDSYTEAGEAATGHADAGADYKCDVCSTVLEPAEGETLTTAQAIALAKALGTGKYSTNSYYLTVTIESVYNTTYGNMNVTDESGAKYVLYGTYLGSYADANRYDKLEYKPVTGDILTVYGAVGSYNSTYQMKNAVITNIVAHTHNYVSVVTEPSCTKGGYTTHTCSICNDTYQDTETEATGHTTDNGTCENCGNVIGGDAPADPTTVSVTIQQYATDNSWANGTYYGQLNMDEVITVSAKASNNNGKYYTSGYEWRMYQSDKGEVTVTANGDYTIETVKITYSLKNGGTLVYNGTNYSSNSVVTVNADTITFSLASTTGATNGQVKITAIEVVYKPVI